LRFAYPPPGYRTHDTANEPTPERDVQALKERIDRLAEEIREARVDWERKRKDRSVTGAEPREDEEAAAG
jgi:uncharacterized small protein (DUF1192 family)